MTMDIIHDFEYYEAHAKDVKVEDITSDGDNADILARLRDNDVGLTSFSVVNEIEVDDDEFDEFVVRECDDLGWLGYFVGRSDKLEQIIISLSPDTINLDAFFEGLGHNRSINTLDFSKDLGESFKSLIPFLRNNDRLRNINFNHFDFGLQSASNIAMLLDQQSSLKYLDFEDFGFDDDKFSQIVIALRSQPQIEELGLSGYNVGKGGFVALGGTLERCHLSLRRLNLRVYDHDNGVTGDEGLNALVAGLKHCHNLTSLSLEGIQITEEGPSSLSTLFHSDNCRLENLRLDEINIDDDDMDVLATGLASLPSLKRLNLWDTFIGDQGLQDLVRGLVNCNLEELSVSSNMLMDSVSGLRSLGTLVRRSTNMRSLTLRDSLTDEGLQSFVEGMANCCNLRELDLARNHLITANGLTSLMLLLRDEHCSLSKLDLYYYGTHLRDDLAVALANGLIGNKSMKTLRFDFSITSITARGWAAFSRLLCDTSSVNNTYLSNHTIEDIGDYSTEDTPRDIVQYLKWNELNDQAAAICKILDSHSDIDITPLFEFNLKCLPLVAAWLEKAKTYLDDVNESTESFQRRHLSAVYTFVRGMPQLAVDGYNREKTKDIQSDAKKKRKFDQTL